MDSYTYICVHYRKDGISFEVDDFSWYITNYVLFFVVWKFPCTIILTIQHWVTLNFSKTTKVLKKCLESSISIHWLLENYVLIGFFLVYQYIINELFYQTWTIESRYLSQELLQVEILGNYLNKLFRSVEF